MRLSSSALDRLRPDIARFAYDRDRQATGIVHFGIGAFHRAHQAWYTDRAMDVQSGARDWAITGVSLRSPGVARQMNPQDGLFSVLVRNGEDTETRVIGAVKGVLVAPREPGRVIDLLAAPSTRIASFTITEKGYCRAADGSLDAELVDRTGIYALLAKGLRRRRQARLAGLTLLSCDNIPANGAQLARLVDEYCERHDPALGRWIAAQCSFPSTMVDRIVPATTPAGIDAAEAALGLRDEAAVITERFSQWVIEDRFVAGRPAWEKVGAELVTDVAPYEMAKLRMLNGAHSALAYLGLAAGHEFVHEAVADPEIRALVERLIRHEAAASLAPAPGQNLEVYADMLLARFADPAINHRLSQIAMDGSQKIPQRWLETLAHHQRHGAHCPSLLTALAAWLRHIRGDNGRVEDPLADRLLAVWRAAGEDGIVDALFGSTVLIASAWRPTRHDRDFITGCLRRGPGIDRTTLQGW